MKNLTHRYNVWKLVSHINMKCLCSSYVTMFSKKTLFETCTS